MLSMCIGMVSDSIITKSDDGSAPLHSSTVAMAPAKIKLIDCDGIVGNGILTPLPYLSFFHGSLKPATAASRLLFKNEYILFLNQEENNDLYAAVYGGNDYVTFIPIHQTDNGHFAIQSADEIPAFSNIHSLVSYYNMNAIPLRTSKGTDVYLQYPVEDKRFERETQIDYNVERGIEGLSYYHPSMTIETLSDRLLQSGDYLIWSASSYGDAILSVRWEQEIKLFAFKLDKRLKAFILPKAKPNYPTETVTSMDAFVKSLVRAKIILKAAQFKRAVPYSGFSVDENAEDNRTAHVGCKKTFLPYALLKNRAPRSLHTLPYFFGDSTPASISTMLNNVGEYLVYFDIITKCVSLAILGKIGSSKLFWCQPIGHDGKYFYISKLDRNRKFRTVEELIVYYQTYKIPLLVGESNQRSESTSYLDKPIQMTNANDEHQNQVENLSYCYENESAEFLKVILRNDGDFLIRKDGNNKLVIMVRWKGHFKDIPLNKSLINGQFIIPSTEADALVEYANTVTELIEALIENQIVIDGVLLKKPIEKL